MCLVGRDVKPWSASTAADDDNHAITVILPLLSLLLFLAQLAELIV